MRVTTVAGFVFCGLIVAVTHHAPSTAPASEAPEPTCRVLATTRGLFRAGAPIPTLAAAFRISLEEVRYATSSMITKDYVLPNGEVVRVEWPYYPLNAALHRNRPLNERELAALDDFCSR